MNIFFSGIGGSGVSALAGLSFDKGHKVSGSDRLFDLNPEHPLCLLMKAKGISIIRQDGKGISKSINLAVFSTAVEGDSPEYASARKLGINIMTRPQYLTEFTASFRSVAVAGTSGKSTTSGMLAFLMHRLGMRPNYIGGGRVKQFRTATNPGNYISGGSDILVFEACESDGTIVDYRPSYSIISNLDLDHHSIRETAVMFEELARHTSGFVLAGMDDINLAGCDLGNPIGFSIDAKSDYQACDIEYQQLSTSFTVRGERFLLGLPGRHNLYNALSCIGCLSELGVPAGDISALLKEFTGIERRFDIHLNNGKYLVVDDYAHNPHKISSLMKTMRGIAEGVCYIFQPHGYGPTRMMKEGYINTFLENLRQTDHLVLLPIYYAGGTASKDISSGDIAQAVRASGRSVSLADQRKDILSTQPGCNTYVVFGARDDTLSDLAEDIAKTLRDKYP